MPLLNHLHFYCVHFLQDKKNAELGHALHCQCNVFSFFSFVSFIFRLCEKPQGKLYKVGVNKIDLNCKVCTLLKAQASRSSTVYHFHEKTHSTHQQLGQLFFNHQLCARMCSGHKNIYYRKFIDEKRNQGITQRNICKEFEQ